MSQTTVPGRPLPELPGPLSFATAALVAYGVVMPVIGVFSALRTATGLMPLASVLVVAAVAAVARTPRVGASLTSCVVALSALSGVMEIRRDLPAANAMGDADRAEAAELAALGTDPRHAVVLTGDPVQFNETTGYPSVAFPSNGLGALAAAARDFHVTHVILDSNNPPGSSDELARALHPLRSVELPEEHSLILELPHTPLAP